MSSAQKQAGFTILELMIATMVFSVILLIVTYGIIQIGNRYYKSVLQTQTQTATRNAVDEIARGVQFSSGGVVSNTAGSPPVKAYCVNDTQYAAQMQVVQGTDAKHVFVARKQPDGSCTPPDADYFKSDFVVDSGDRDLLGDRMRVVDFSVAEPSSKAGVYTVKLRIASGENDLLCSPSATDNDCNKSGNTDHADSTDLNCKAQKGSAYCAVSELSTTVIPRLKP